MRGKIEVFILLVLLAQAATAQKQPPAILNPALAKAITRASVNDRMVSLLVQGDLTAITRQTKLLGGIFKFSVRDIASITLPLNRVATLAHLPGILRIEGLYGTGQMLDEVTLVNANVTPVNLGYAPLTQGYDGSGVVMALLDDGIDFNHPDFKNADGTTRILHIWDQTATSGGTMPQPYNYGQEWDSAVINSGTCPYYETSVNYGHGSNVAGIATGNGSAVNNFFGVAPACDIISVNVALDENFLNNVVDGASYALSIAAALDKPCVLNASLGTYAGSHDGDDLAAQAINDLLDQQAGSSFVCAAGNAGGIPFHLGYEAQDDSAFTWFKYLNGVIHYEWWINKDAASAFRFAIGADNPAGWVAKGRTAYYNLVNDFNYANGMDSLKDTLFDNATRIGIITFYAYETDSTYACEVTVKPDFSSYYWRFITGGSGRFDCWSAAGLTGTSDMVTTALPDSGTFPDITRYRMPDAQQTIVSSFTCSDHVITVGNYTNRDQFIDYYGNLQTFAAAQGSLAWSSSSGPTRDGRIKPDLAAPGDVTLASGLVYLMDDYIHLQPYKTAIGGMHIKNGGTSMASPVVAGVAALMLQKNPAATWKELKDAMKLSAFHDDFTGNSLPDNTWGYGKINAFGAITTTPVYGCMDPFSINFNPSANVDDGSCQPIVFGCTDVNALNYDAAANMNNGSCTYGVGISDPETAGNFFCYPNPASAFTTFFFNTTQTTGGNARLLITSADGKGMRDLFIPPSENHLTLTLQLPAGIYFCRLLINGVSTGSAKLFVTQ